MKLTREYTHKRFGAIGSVELEAPDGKWTLDGHELPEGSIRHLLTFALQTLQDAYAGADSADEAQGAFAKKHEKLVNGTLGVRGAGSGMDDRQRAMISEARSTAKDAIEGYADMAPADRDAAVWEWLEELPEGVRAVYEEAADEAIEEAKRKAERRAKLAAATKVDL